MVRRRLILILTKLLALTWPQKGCSPLFQMFTTKYLVEIDQLVLEKKWFKGKRLKLRADNLDI